MLHNLLEKLGLKYEDLTAEEKKTYTEWAEQLGEADVTIDDLKKFIPSQLAHLESDQNDYKNSKEKDLFLKAQIRNLKMINAFILGPEQRRKWVQEQINQAINK